MKGNIEILKKYIIYILIGIVICLIGATGVFADTTLQSFSAFNSTASSYTNSINYNNEIYVVDSVDMYNYSMDFEWTSTNSKTCSTGAVVSGNLRIEKLSMGITNQDFNWQNVYIVNNNNRSNCSWQVHDTYTSYVCTLDSLNTNFKIGYTLNPMGGQFTYSSYIFRNIDISCDTSTSQIIENNSQNTQNIINNNNSNTDKIIESNKVCSNEFTINSTSDFASSFTIGSLSSSGTINSSTTSWRTSDFISIKKGDVITFTGSTSVFPNSIGAFYNKNKSFISSINSRSYTADSDGYIRYNFPNYNFPSSLEICENGNQAAEKTRKGILAKLKELFNFFNNDDDADVSGLNNMAGWLPPGPLDSIINLPLNLFNALVNTLSGTCSAVTLTLPFVGQTLTLPCFDTFMSQYLTGFSTIWTFIGVTVSIFILYNYLLTLYKWVDDTLTLRENNLPGYYDDNWGGGA